MTGPDAPTSIAEPASPARLASLVRRGWSLLTGGERRRARSLAGLMVLGMACETIGIGLVIPAIALLSASASGTVPPLLHHLLDRVTPDSRATSAGVVLVAAAVVYMLRATVLTLIARQETRFVFDVRGRLSRDLFATYLAQPYPFHLGRNSGELIHNVMWSVDLGVVDGLTAALLLITESLVLVGVTTLLFVVEPLGAVAAVLIAALLAWGGHRWMRDRVAHAAREADAGDEYRLRHVQEGLGAVKEAKVLGREPEFLRRYDAHADQSARAGATRYFLGLMVRIGLELVAVLALLAFVGVLLARGRSPASITAAVGLFAASAFRLMPSVHRILVALNGVQYSAPAIEMLHRDLAGATPAPPRAAVDRLPFTDRVIAHEVTFTYPGADRRALDAVSVFLTPRETIGIVGPSGAGKSTLVDVLLGLYAADGGDIRVDGRDVRGALRAWQNQLGYVPQSIHLADDTIRNNIAFGIPESSIDETAVARAAHAAQLGDVLAGGSKGLDTVVGERGVRLSGGQRQRIGIARALYHDPAVLVLDEATSALDSAMEAEVLSAVRGLRGTRAIVVVAHRLSTVRHCDRVYRLEAGRIVGEERPGAQ